MDIGVENLIINNKDILSQMLESKCIIAYIICILKKEEF